MTTQQYFNTLKINMIGQLEVLSKKYDITKTDMDKFMSSVNFTIPLRKKTILTYEQKCKARKQDGTQCSRRHKPNETFCGKHIHNQKYGLYKLVGKSVKSQSLEKKSIKPSTEKIKKGRKSKNKKEEIENSQQHILLLKSVQIQNKYYYIDKYNVLYNPDPINGQYEIIGRLKNNMKDIYYTTSL
jgi:hypothetical protein